MEELMTIKSLLLEGDIQSALVLVEELEQMTRQDIINQLRSLGVILLRQLIQQQTVNKINSPLVETEIQKTVLELQELQKQLNGVDDSFIQKQFLQVLEIAYPSAVDQASSELAQGRYDAEDLETMINRDKIVQQALQLVFSSTQN